MPQEAVIFDMDGVMIDSEMWQLQSFNAALSNCGVALSEEEFIRWCVGRNASENFSFVINHFDLNVPVETLLAQKHSAYWAILQANIAPMPGLEQLVDELRNSKYTLAVASSSQQSYIDLVLERLNLKETFSVAVSGEDVKKGKPEPDIFLETARRLGIVPEKCTVIEDSYFGVLAAVNAGMRCFAVPNRFTAEQDFSKAHVRVSGLETVADHLAIKVDG